MRRLWKFLRWGAFFFALAVDAAIFYNATPFSAQSFAAAGIASLIMFLVFVKLATLIRNGARIRRMLEPGEKRVYETGLHWVRLLSNVRKDRPAYRFIGVPLQVALFVTLFMVGWALWWLGSKTGLREQGWFETIGILFRILPDNMRVLGGYIPLIFAIPFVIAHIAEWSTHRYVITRTRIIIMSGIFDYEVHTITLSRVVDAKQHYTFWQQVWNYGDVVLRETAGNDETMECVWGPKKFAKVAMQYSHAADSE